MAHLRYSQGFSLIQMSVIMTLTALVMVAVLPSYQNPSGSNKVSANKMNTILNALRQYEVAYGMLPCPADPTIAIGNSNYGIAMSNGGTGAGNNCINSIGSQVPYADATQHIAIGMVPVRTLGLSYDAALDGYGRDISYIVDTSASGCWSSSALQGNVTVTDNGITRNTVAALASYGSDGYGAWIPKQGTGGSNTGTRLTNSSMDSSEAANAELTTAGVALGNNQFVSLIEKPATTTFDDLVIYRSENFNINAMPATNPYGSMTSYPQKNTYTNTSSPNYLSFTITFPHTITYTGSPRIDIAVLPNSGSYSGTVISGSTGSATTYGYATLTSSTSNTLTFQYNVQSSDNAPYGIVVNPYIDLNGGTLSGASTCFISPNLSGVILAPVLTTYIWAVNGGSITQQLVAFSTASGANPSSSSTFGSTSYTGLGSTAYQAVAVDSNGNIWAGTRASTINEYSAAGSLTNSFSISAYVAANDTYMMTFDPVHGYLWVSDATKNTIYIFNTSGTELGSVTSSFTHQQQIAFDHNGSNLYMFVADPGNVRVVSCTINGTGTGASSCSAAATFCNGNQLAGVYGIGVDQNHIVWVADPNSSMNMGAGVVEEYTYDGTPGTLSSASCTIRYLANHPTYIAMDSTGSYLWVSNTAGHSIQEYSASSFGSALVTAGNSSSLTNVTGISLSPAYR